VQTFEMARMHAFVKQVGGEDHTLPYTLGSQNPGTLHL
jgi:hypothetical protein